MENMPHLSATGIDMYLRCPLSWKKKYIDKAEGFSQDSVALKQGNAVHDALEEIVKDKIEDPDEIDTIITQCCNNYGLFSEEDRREVFEMIYYEISFVIENQSNEEVVGTEVEFSININNCEFVGKIDKLTKIDDKTYRVVDYKTGNYIDYDGFDFHVQLTLYSIAVYEMFPDCEYVIAELHYLRKQERITYDAGAKSIDNLINISGVISEDKEFAPNVGTHCCFCDYRFTCERRNSISAMTYNMDSLPEEELLSFYNELRAQKTLIEEKEAIIKEIIKNHIENSGSKSVAQGNNIASLSQNSRTFYNSADLYDVLLQHGISNPMKYFTPSIAEVKKLAEKDKEIAKDINRVSFTKYGDSFIRMRTTKTKEADNGADE